MRSITVLRVVGGVSCGEGVGRGGGGEGIGGKLGGGKGGEEERRGEGGKALRNMTGRWMRK